MFKRLLSASLTAGLLLVGQAAHAQWIVFDPTNFAQNVITAAKAVKGEIYQDTNIIYQYKMMANQLLQAANLNPVAMAAQMDVIKGGIQSTMSFVNNAKSLYGSLTDASAWIGQVQAMASAAGKSPKQWLNDQNTLAQNGNTAAMNLFQQGSDIAQQTQTLANRREELQQQLNVSQTQQQTATITTHYLDILASQNASLMSLAAQQAQISAQKQSEDSAQEQSNIQAQQTRINQQNTEFSTLNGLSN